MSDQPSLLILASHFEPGFKAGGPIRSMVGIIDGMADHFRIRLVTGDRDLGDGAPYPGVATDSWVRHGDAEVRYLSPAHQGPAGIARLLRETPHDLLYINSVFARPWSIVPLLARRAGLAPRTPLLIAPRGEFSPGALGLKAGRKRQYLALARRIGLFRDAHWHASAPHEAADIHSTVGAADGRVHLASNFARVTEVFDRRVRRGPDEPLKLLFLSRIAPMKNLDAALESMALVRSRVDFTIHGTEEDAEHVATCRRLAAALPPHVRVTWAGPVAATDVPATMAEHDLFFLPTRGENYGHVIAEAVGAHLPLLLSDRTPWRGLERHGVGWDLPLDDPSAFARVIDMVAGWSEDEHRAIQDRVARYARTAIDNREAINDHRRMFEATIAASRGQ